MNLLELLITNKVIKNTKDFLNYFISQPFFCPYKILILVSPIIIGTVLLYFFNRNNATMRQAHNKKSDDFLILESDFHELLSLMALTECILTMSVLFGLHYSDNQDFIIDTWHKALVLQLVSILVFGFFLISCIFSASIRSKLYQVILILLSFNFIFFVVSLACMYLLEKYYTNFFTIFVTIFMLGVFFLYKVVKAFMKKKNYP